MARKRVVTTTDRSPTRISNAARVAFLVWPCSWRQPRHLFTRRRVRKIIQLFPFASTLAQIVHRFRHRVPDSVLRIGSFVTPNEKKGNLTGGLYEIPTDD